LAGLFAIVISFGEFYLKIYLKIIFDITVSKQSKNTKNINLKQKKIKIFKNEVRPYSQSYPSF
jgi:RecA/RadA recombinase